MKIAYVASAPVPSRVARSVNIVKSCAALAALGHQVVLLLTEAHADEVEPGVDDVFAFYDVPRSFEIRWLPTPRRFGGRTLFSLAVRLAPDEASVSTTVGWMQQLSALGQFLGPPLVAWVAAAAGGWHWTWVATGSCCLLGLVVAQRIHRQLVHART